MVMYKDKKDTLLMHLFRYCIYNDNMIQYLLEEGDFVAPKTKTSSISINQLLIKYYLKNNRFDDIRHIIDNSSFKDSYLPLLKDTSFEYKESRNYSIEQYITELRDKIHKLSKTTEEVKPVYVIFNDKVHTLK